MTRESWRQLSPPIRPKSRSRRRRGRLEEPTHPQQDRIVVHAQIGRSDPGVGNMDEAILDRQSEIIAQKITNAHAQLKVEFKIRAQVAVANVRVREARACVNEWNPPMTGREIVAKQRGDPGKVRRLGNELPA